MRILAAVAHYGTKNRCFLERMLQGFESMTHDVDVVVLSEAPKDLGPDVEVIVGLPSENPWSLPFAHRQLFADRRDDHDLFLYAEDDTLLLQRHVDAFVELARRLPDGYLPGFMRYETRPDGSRSYSTIHSHYRWDPSSVFRHDGLTFASFTNPHGAAYLLTREQLHRAIDSGGFLVPPHEGEYDMLVSAATDPYTRCGFRKVLCLERIDDLLLHHLPNVYLDKFGIDERSFRAQVDALISIGRGELAPTEYLRPETRMGAPTWNRHCYPHSDVGSVKGLGPPGRLLSLGVGDGSVEADLARSGWEVSVVPIDAVLASAASSRGLCVQAPGLLAMSAAGSPTAFDVVLALDVLPYLEDPVAELRAAAATLADGGRLVVTVPDHRRYALRNRLLPRSDTPVPHHHASDGVHRTDRRVLLRWLSEAGLRVRRLEHRRATRSDPLGVRGAVGSVLANSWLAVAEPST